MVAEPLLSGSLAELVAAVSAGQCSAHALVSAAIDRHEQSGGLDAWVMFDGPSALAQADQVDRAIGQGKELPLAGVPVSVKDIFGVEGWPTHAGSIRPLPPERWSKDAWLVSRLRKAGAVVMGKTHTVEFAYGGVGANPHWGTPRNPWSHDEPRIPGGSSCGAGVSLWEGSALLALGSDTGGSIRIPAAFTGVVGHKTTKGLWPTDGVVPLSTTFDTVGALTRSVEDSIWFYGSVDPQWGKPQLLLDALSTSSLEELRVGVPECTLWEACAPPIRDVLESALEELEAAGATTRRVVAPLLDDAEVLYMTGGIGQAEISAFLSESLPEWPPILHPIVGDRLRGAHPLDGPEYRDAIAAQRRMAAFAETLFAEADVIVLPGNLITAPPVAEVLADLDRYGEVNRATLRPTCPVNLLGLCAISIPVGLDEERMPVGLQLVARGGDDEALLGIALACERVLGTGAQRLGRPPLP